MEEGGNREGSLGREVEIGTSPRTDVYQENSSGEAMSVETIDDEGYQEDAVCLCTELRG